MEWIIIDPEGFTGKHESRLNILFCFRLAVKCFSISQKMENGRSFTDLPEETSTRASRWTATSTKTSPSTSSSNASLCSISSTSSSPVCSSLSWPRWCTTCLQTVSQHIPFHSRPHGQVYPTFGNVGDSGALCGRTVLLQASCVRPFYCGSCSWPPTCASIIFIFL